MATYLYCLRSDPVAPSDWLIGIDGGRVRGLDVDGLLAWVGDVQMKTLEPTVERIRAHDAVLAAALESGETPLPVRFGQTFADDTAAVHGIAARAAELRPRIERIAGCVELRVVITAGQVPEETPEGSSRDPLGEDPRSFEGPGTAFLKRLARAGRAEMAREVGCEEVRHAVRAAARSLIVDQHPCETARGNSYFPVLVHREDVIAFRSALANTLPSQAIGLSVLGPFAPYSFAGDA